MKKKHVGSSFDDFLKEQSIFDHSSAVAVKRVIAWQIEQEMIKQNLTKTLMAKKMHTSRAALNRLLDESDTSLTLLTLTSAASALGKMIKFEMKTA
jgi:antitoxin HicB